MAWRLVAGWVAWRLVAGWVAWRLVAGWVARRQGMEAGGWWHGGSGGMDLVAWIWWHGMDLAAWHGGMAREQVIGFDRKQVSFATVFIKMIKTGIIPT